MTVPRTRWTDDRLDDLHALVQSTDRRVDRNEKLVDAHDQALTDMHRAGDRRQDSRRAIYLMLATILAGELVQLLARFAH